VRWALFILLGCGSETTAVDDEPRIEDVAGIRPERTYYVKTASGAVFGGFDGALERAIDGIEPDARGRFRVELEPDPIFSLSVGLEYRLRDPAAARESAVRPVLSGAGSVPNDLVIAGGEDAYGVLVRSGDGGISVVDLARGISEQGARIRGHPFFVGVIDAEARRVAVSDYDGGEVHVVDLVGGRVERTLSPPEVTLSEPFLLSRPYDVDGDGAEEESIARFVARSPQAVVAAEGRLLAGFSGFVERRLDGERGPLFVPSVIASWRLDALDAAPELLVLDALNVQELRVLEDGRALAVCSGVLETDGGARALTEGSVIVLNAGSLAIEERIRMDYFAPGSALFAADRLVVSSLVHARVRIVGDGTQELALNGETTDSIFRLVDLGGGLVGVPSFNTDRLHILDARTGALDPEPFFAPLAIGPGRPLFDGLQIVAARPGRRGVDFTGPDLVALTGQASELVPIELRKVLGP
jgi:hypothetical protein